MKRENRYKKQFKRFLQKVGISIKVTLALMTLRETMELLPIDNKKKNKKLARKLKEIERYLLELNEEVVE